MSLDEIKTFSVIVHTTIGRRKDSRMINQHTHAYHTYTY